MGTVMDATAARPARGTLLTSLLILAAAVGVDKSQAADFAYGADLGLGRTDNIDRTAGNKRSENIASAGVQFSLLQQSRRLETNVLGDLAFLDYLKHTYRSEVVGNFTGLARLAIIPERLVWVFQDNFGQVKRDLFAPATPGNRENINYFTTGPELTARFGGQVRGQLSGEYSKITYQSSPFDNDRYSGSLGLIRDLTDTSAVSANVRAEKVRFGSNRPRISIGKRPMSNIFSAAAGRQPRSMLAIRC
jgi:hypothetical protein